MRPIDILSNGSATAYALCIYAGTSTAAIAEADIAPSSTLWAPKGTTGFKYKDPALSARMASAR